MAKERWASRLGLVLAMAGNAVGLGNFLRFPAQAVQNGGGAFLIPYLVALLVLGLPLIWVEWAMGRFGGQHGHHSTPGIFQAHGKSPFWKYFGVLGLWSCLVIAAFYLYIESWCMTYAAYSAINGFNGMSKDQVTGFFAAMTGERDNQILAIGWWGMIVFVLCVVINIYILSKGLAAGIEFVSKIGMPLLIVFATILAVCGLFLRPGVDPGVVNSPLVGLNFVWEPKLESLADPKVWLAAAGQIFFTLAIGMGSIHCFASYLREQDDVALTGATAAWTNELCEVILGGTILIPIAVAYLGLPAVQEATAEGSGFGLGFYVFPTLFNQWGWFAPVAGFMWFGLLFFAAITSSLAMGQPIMAFLQEEFKFSRAKSAVAFGVMLAPLSLGVAVTHSDAFLGEFDYWAGTFGLVVFAFGEAVLFAWIFGMDRGWAEIAKGSELRVPRFFYYIIQYVTPIFLFLILLAYTFEPEAGWTTHIRQTFGMSDSKQNVEWRWSKDGMIGKILQVNFDRQIAKLENELKQLEQTSPNNSDELKMTFMVPKEIAESIRESIGQADSDKAKLEAVTKAAGKGWLELSEALEKLEGFKSEKLTETKNAIWAETITQKKAKLTFLPQLRMTQNLDRLFMVGTFLFLCVLVWVAWNTRVREGRA